MSASTDSQDSPLLGAVVISGAGTADADGVYKATGKEYCNAPIYEHIQRGNVFKITREPHTNPKTGQTKHGWLLGQSKTPLYGAPTESLRVPVTVWKKFNGAAPVPTVKVYQHFVDVYYTVADQWKVSGDAAAERQDWKAAVHAFTQAVEALKRSTEKLGGKLNEKAALLLARRGSANMKLQDFKAALRDAIAALEMVRSFTPAEAVALEAAKALGLEDEASVRKLMEPVGHGRLLNPDTPMVLRCVERWILGAFEAIEDDSPIPEVTYEEMDTVFDGWTDEQKEEFIKKCIPQAKAEQGGDAFIESNDDCLKLMKKWEKVLLGKEFQNKRKALWDRKGLSLPKRLEETRKMLAETLTQTYEPLGFTPGLPGLNRVVKQMQFYWSKNLDTARKAMELEDIADVSLADLQS